MYYDPHCGTQIRALRTDPTGRWKTISDTDTSKDPSYLGYLIGALAGLLLAAAGYFAL